MIIGSMVSLLVPRDHDQNQGLGWQWNGMVVDVAYQLPFPLCRFESARSKLRYLLL